MSTAPDWQSRVAPLLAEGLSPAVIAEQLGVSLCSIERVRRGMQAPAWAFEDLPPQIWPVHYAGGATLVQIASRTGLPSYGCGTSWWRGGDVALLQAAAARLGVQVPSL